MSKQKKIDNTENPGNFNLHTKPVTIDLDPETTSTDSIKDTSENQDFSKKNKTLSPSIKINCCRLLCFLAGFAGGSTTILMIFMAYYLEWVTLDLGNNQQHIENLSRTVAVSNNNQQEIKRYIASLQAIEERLELLEKSDTDTKFDMNTKITERISVLEENISKIFHDISLVDFKNIPNLRESNKKIEKLEKQVNTFDQDIHKQLLDRIKVLEKLVLEDNHKEQTANKILIALKLDDAISRGTSFSSVLNIFENQLGISEQTRVLRSYANTGIPTIEQLRAQLMMRINESMPEKPEKPKNQGIIDWLVNGAKSLVKVRKIEQIEKSSVFEMILKFEKSLNNRNPDNIIDSWEQLPYSARKVLSQWKTDFDMRIYADKINFLEMIDFSFIKSISEPNVGQHSPDSSSKDN